MKIDPYNHEKRYKVWKAQASKHGIPDISKQNSDIILKYVNKNGESSLKELDIKLRSGFRSIKIQVKELEFFGAIEIIQTKKNPKTGRPSTSVKITERCSKFVRNIKN